MTGFDVSTGGDLMTDETRNRDQIRERADKATEGPWHFAYCGIYSEPKIRTETPDGEAQVASVAPSYGDTATGQRVVDAEFIAAARSDVPYLLDALDAAEQERDHAQQMGASLYWDTVAARDAAEAREAALRQAIADEAATIRSYHVGAYAPRIDAAHLAEVLDALAASAPGGAEKPPETTRPSLPRDMLECNGLCLTAADVDVHVAGNPVAHAHLSCPLHGNPAEFGERNDRLLDEYRVERDAAIQRSVQAERKLAEVRGDRNNCAEQLDVAALRIIELQATLDRVETVFAGGAEKAGDQR
jgi:hypothetical protein